MGFLAHFRKFYGCGYADHYLLGGWILENVLGLDPETNDAKITLDDKGWIRIQRSAFETSLSVMCQKKPTQKQINSLFDHSEVYGTLYIKTQDVFFENGGLTKIFAKK